MAKRYSLSKRMCRFGIIINTLLLWTSICFGQESFSKFLQETLQDPSLKVYDQQVAYLQTKPYRLSPFQKIEVRTESNQLDPNRQDYALRINPANPWEIREENRYFKELATTLVLEKKILLRKLLQNRFKLIIEVLAAKERARLLNSELILLKQQVEMLQNLSYTSYFDADDYVKLLMNEIEISVDSQEASNSYKELKEKVLFIAPTLANDVESWNFSDLLEISRIPHLLDSLPSQTNSTELLFSGKIALANRAYALEKTNVNIGFLQTQYQPFRVEQGRKPWNIGLGITLPISNPNRGDMARKQLSIFKTENEFRDAKTELKIEQEESLQKLTNLISQVNLLEQRIQAIPMLTLSSTLTQLKGNDPLVQSKMTYALSKLHRLQVDLKEKTLLTYIEYLVSMEVLEQTPLINYLSNTQDLLTND